MKKNNKNYLSDLVCVAFLIALDIVMTRFLSINTQFLRIGFGFLPVAVAGAAFGPAWGAACGAIGDILGFMIYPAGTYFPGFTLTALLTGLVFGLFLHRQHISFIRCLMPSVIVCLVLNLLLDTLWLDILYGSGYLVLLPARAVKCFINIPVYSFLLYAVWSRLLSKIRIFHAAA